MATHKIIVAGDVREGVEEWLTAHGARVEHCLGLTLAELPARAEIYQEHGAMQWHVTVSFYDKGNEEPTYLDIEDSADDAQETVWALVTQ